MLSVSISDSSHWSWRRWVSLRNQPKPRADFPDRKSQLAIEYAYQVRAQSPDTWVFWVHASSLARFEEGYRRIADVVKLPGCDKLEADILQLIRNWLCDERNGHWVMMIDNADDPSIFFSQLDRTKSSECNGSAQASNCLTDVLPQLPNGSILIMRPGIEL